MRRRDLLTLTTAMAGAAIVGTTGCTPESPAPVDDPPPEGFPINFADSPAWSGSNAPAWSLVLSETEFTAVKDRHLVAMTVVPEAERAFAYGLLPVVVDVTGPTTRALLLDDDGTWITKPVKPKESGPRSTELSQTALTAMHQGPAVIDDTHAYVVAGVLSLETPGQFENTSSSEAHCPVMLFKIRLDDGAVVASTTVSDDISFGDLPSAALSFSEDGTALLLVGGTPPANDDADSNAGFGWMGLRLSTADLSVEFDARALYVGQEVTSVSPAGQAVLVSLPTAFSTQNELVRLTDGVRMRTASRQALAIGDWVHWSEQKDSSSEELVAVNTRTGQRVTVAPEVGDPKDLLDAFTSWPRIFCGTPVATHWSEKDLTVWRPGAPEPSVHLTEKEAVRAGVAVLKDVIYTWHGDDTATTLTLRRLDSGEVLAEHSVPPRVLGSGTGAVTPWGCISGSKFFRATKWLD